MPGEMTLARRVSTMILLLRAAGSSGLNARMVWNMARQTGSAPIAKRILNRRQVNTIGLYLAGVGLVEGLGELGEGKEAGRYYPIIAEALNSTGAVLNYFGARLIEPIAGIAAAGAGLWQEAEAHFQKAMRQADEFPHKLEQPEVRRRYARMLVERDAPGDRDEARQLLREAVAMYREIGMPKRVEMTEALLSQTRS
jgi:tetratricopeptide (TPR) repeat protein